MDDADDPVIDRLTRELRREFLLLKRAEEKRQKAIEKQDRQTQRLARKAEKLAKKQSEKTSARARAAQAAALEERLNPPRKCPDCGAETRRSPGELNLPGLCHRCRQKLAEAQGGFKARAITQYSEIEVVPGGAPGSGKRK